MTIDPIIRLMMTMVSIEKNSRTLSTSHVRPYHHSSAPPTMLRYPNDISMGWLGITNANWAKVARNRNIINGLDTVTRNAVTKLCNSVPFWFFLLSCTFFRGSLLKQYSPKQKSSMLPNICRQNLFCGSSMSSMTKLMPKPVISA